jgi:tRNA pseudouridine38-40 synthase
MSNTPVRNFSARVAYDGSDYAGFQLQPNHPTIQGELEKALAKVLDDEVRVHGASRTDAGVHALGQMISFRNATLLPGGEIERAINALLPADIRVGPVVERDDDFHARFSACGKRYVYRFYRGERESPFLNRFSLWEPGSMDIERMEYAASMVQGERDYRSFSSRLYEGENPVKMLGSLTLSEKGDLLEVSMTGSGFLFQMARRVTAVILKVGKGELETDEISIWLVNPEVGACRFIVPPKGLFLMEVYY